MNVPVIVRTTERLTLSRLMTADFETVYAIWSDPSVMRHCGGVTSRQEEEQAFARYLERDQTTGLAPYLIRLKETGEAIGIAGFNPKQDDSDAELVVHLNKTYWHQGFAREACLAVLSIAVKRRDLTTLGATVEVENHSSRRLLEAIGFAHPVELMDGPDRTPILRYLLDLNVLRKGEQP